MKKKIVCLAMLLLSLSLLCGMASAKEVAGKWTLTRTAALGIEMEASELGIEMVFILEADGTGMLYSDIEGKESKNTCAWIRQGNVVTIFENGTSYDYTLSGDELVGEVDGVTMVMTREETAAIPEKTSYSMADFNGSWECFLLCYKDEVLTMEELDSSMRLELENGKGTMAIRNEDETTVAPVTARLYETLQHDGGGVVTVLELVNDNDSADVMRLIPQGENVLVYHREARDAFFVLERQEESTENTVGE